LVNNFSIWKVETWIGYAYTARPFTGTDVAGESKIALGNGITAHSFSRGNENFKIVNGGLAFTDTNRTAGNKTLLLQQTADPYLGQIQVTPSHPFKVSFYKPNDAGNTQIPYDGSDIVVVDGTGKTVTVAAAAGTLTPGQYTIRLNIPADIAIDYGQAKAIPAGTQFTIGITGPSTGAPAPFSVVYGLDGKIKSVTNNNDVNDRRSDTSGMRLVPTLIGEEVANEKGISIDQLTDDLRLQMDSWERSAGYQDLGAKQGTIDIDWSKGKYLRSVTLASDLAITMSNPPPSPQFLEIMVMQAAGNKYELTGITAPQALVKPIGGKDVDPGAPLWIKLFWDGQKYYTDTEDL
ncbi:MAG: hypothetical protein KDE53_04620, partial [Caldilineaceae bacterium]|nr:hypothetical protein [Caldilineaceae bacterium]